MSKQGVIAAEVVGPPSFHAPTMQPSSCVSHQAEQRLPRLPRTVELFDRRFVNGYFIPVPGVAAGDPRTMMREFVHEALVPVLPALVVEMIADYSHLRSPRVFAEGLYRELREGRTRILFRELYNVKERALREPHVFWDYLAQATLPTYVVLHYMLEQAKERRHVRNRAEEHRTLSRRLERFARLVGKKFPKAAYFVRHNGHGARPFLFNVGIDEWPQVLQDDFYHGHLLAARACFLLVHKRQRQLERLVKVLGGKGKDEWHMILCALNAASTALLQEFLCICLSVGMLNDRVLFSMVASLARSANPQMSSLLRHHGVQSGWSELIEVSDLDNGMDEVLESKSAGGSVHLQPLLHFVPSSVVARDYRGDAVASLSGKTFKKRDFLAFVAADDMLHVLRAPCYEYLYIRSFQDGAVCMHPLVSDQLVSARVEHGDLVAVTMLSNTPEIFSKLHVFDGLPADERFKRIMEFCFLARSARFLAIVQSDRHAEEQ